MLEEEKNMELNAKEGLYYIIFSLILGIVFDRLFFKVGIGISHFIFLALCMSFFIWSLRKSIKIEKNLGWFLLIPISLLSFSYTLYTNVVFMLLNLVIIPFLMVVSSILIQKPELKWDKFTFIFYMVKKGIINVLESIGSPFAIIRKLIVRKEKSKNKTIRNQILIGLVISVPLLIIILGLLNNADMVFSYYLNNITTIFDNINLNNVLPHLILIIIIAFYLFGYVWGFKKEDKDYEKILNLENIGVEALIIITVLVVLNVLYLLFTIIQFSYLYGGGNMDLPAGFTYAEYARRGFFELAAVTFINFIIVLCCLKYMKKENKKLVTTGNILFSFLILFTLNMLYSANFKLSLYEGSYGYTYLRVFVHLFMLLLFILSIIALIGIWYRKLPIVKCLIVITLIMYTVINYINIDAFIAKKNIERYNNTGKIDISYLTSLSYEAVPYLVELRNAEDPNMRAAIDKKLNNMKAEILRQKHLSEFNFSRSRAEKLINVIGK
ncbi:DUF4153 domain-containing protein [Candidatus Clostridium radicumherbarum]|uniref:DUF4153 domain-containing protein n=1 Tax=Candidatus Clostridium radicumherbarum TaxID=3381662 RepID=A0ABW8TQ73_9CLOT